jgi:hypothetical protein
MSRKFVVFWERLIYLYLKSKITLERVSQKTKLTLRFVAVMVVLLALGMQSQFVIIPALSTYKFWLVVGAFALLLIAGH